MTICKSNTPVVFYPELAIWVKHEHECNPGGPNFSKMRGVEAHVRSRPEVVIGVLDTSHSQGGWAVAQACAALGKKCVLYYPQLKGRNELPIQQEKAADLGAVLQPLPGGRSAVLYHRAKQLLPAGGYMMPNALKLAESVSETASEVQRTDLKGIKSVIVSASSGTIAAGVIQGLAARGWDGRVVVHLGYSRPERAVRAYIERMSGLGGLLFREYDIVDEGYAYADKVRNDIDLPFASNVYYDRKAVLWYLREGRKSYPDALIWNIG